MANVKLKQEEYRLKLSGAELGLIEGALLSFLDRYGDTGPFSEEMRLLLADLKESG